MRIIRAADCRVMPWKNGGGSTTQITIHPEGASLDDFEWRISMAHVGSDGPFSAFPGIDRTLSILDGNGIRLEFGDNQRVALDRRSEPFAFAADRPVTGQLMDGPIDDLNVMTRRGRWRHRVTRLDRPCAFARDCDILVLVAIDVGWRVSTDGREAGLGERDGVLLAGAGEPCRLDRDGAGELYAIELRAADRINLTLVTCNTRDFDDLPLKLFNPWAD